MLLVIWLKIVDIQGNRLIELINSRSVSTLQYAMMIILRVVATSKMISDNERLSIIIKRTIECIRVSIKLELTTILSAQ